MAWYNVESRSIIGCSNSLSLVQVNAMSETVRSTVRIDCTVHSTLSMSWWQPTLCSHCCRLPLADSYTATVRCSLSFS